MASRTVGKSSRTPVKHFLLNAIVGKIAGVLSLDNHRVPAKANPFLCVDLCGGDGTESDKHEASPKILAKHCRWLSSRGLDCELVVIEKDENTFTQLKKNVTSDVTLGFECRLLMGDAREYTLPQLSYQQAVFVHCDPNAVDQIPLTKPFVSSFNASTTYLVTLGCNVAGLKRLDLSQRSTWFEYIRDLTDALPRHHDAVLFWLNRDSSQWAYLLSLPQVWSQQFKVDCCAATSKKWEHGVSAASFRTERSEFTDQVNRLFLTAKEYGDEN